MKPLKNLSDINTNTKEGRYLIAALSILTTQPRLELFKEEKQGTAMTPDEMLDAVYKLAKEIYEKAGDIPESVEEPKTFEQALTGLINKYCQENASNTPDFILAKFVRACLDSFNDSVHSRDKWYGVNVNLSPSKIVGNSACQDLKPEPISDKELLKRAAEEIKWLRQRNEVMSARLNMFDTVVRVMDTYPNRDGAGLVANKMDVAWEIEKRLSS